MLRNQRVNAKRAKSFSLYSATRTVKERDNIALLDASVEQARQQNILEAREQRLSDKLAQQLLEHAIAETQLLACIKRETRQAIEQDAALNAAHEAQDATKSMFALMSVTR